TQPGPIAPAAHRDVSGSPDRLHGHILYSVSERPHYIVSQKKNLAGRETLNAERGGRMNATMASQPRHLTGASALLLGIPVLFALLSYAVLRYPASLSQGGQLSLLLVAGTLLAYAAAALWARGRASDSLQIALEQGARIGYLLGTFAMLNHTVEIFAALDSS